MPCHFTTAFRFRLSWNRNYEIASRFRLYRNRILVPFRYPTGNFVSGRTLGGGPPHPPMSDNPAIWFIRVLKILGMGGTVRMRNSQWVSVMGSRKHQSVSVMVFRNRQWVSVIVYYRDRLTLSQVRYGDWLTLSEAHFGNWQTLSQAC